MNRPAIHRNLLIIGLLDIGMLSASLVVAYLMRFDFSIPVIFKQRMLLALPLVLATKLIIFHFFNLYRGMWRYTSIADLMNVIKAATASSLVILAMLLFGTRFVYFPRSVFLIDWCLTILLISGSRLGVRIFFERMGDSGGQRSMRESLRAVFRPHAANKRKLVIVGGGDAGEKIFRELRDNPNLPFNVIGFLDDNPSKHGKTIHGLPVLGAVRFLAEPAFAKLDVDEILIAIPSATASQMRAIVTLCKTSGLPFKTVPGLGELIDGRVSVRTIREVAYRDLLGREVIHLEEQRIGAYLRDACILVTGAGGSIGSELCRQIVRFRPRRIVLFERAESPLYEIELDLRQRAPKVEVVPVLGDILDETLLETAFHGHRPSTVFHAAAYKHVPMLELQPWRAVTNNIEGTACVVAAAKRSGVDRFVFVSTDKAVRPANVMGASKRVAELLVQCQRNQTDTATKFMIVRFGNVVGSVGSVVPLFKKQIERGGPVTVTHPEVTRYFMTIPEACQLILQAGSMGEGNEIFILDMGTPIKIADMARDLIRLSGYEPGVDIKIDYIGLRPGEKLYEELITEGEGIVPTGHQKIVVLNGHECRLEDLEAGIRRLLEQAGRQDGAGIRATLQALLPEYAPAVIPNCGIPGNGQPIAETRARVDG
jgi:FlaA1/EpsC-like NDP-sugar epimerase